MKQAFLDRYGNPDANDDGILDVDWFRENIVVFELPFPLIQSWGAKGEIRRFQAHRLAGARIVAAYSRIGAYKGIPYLRENKLDIWGGCWNFRRAKGWDVLSVHAWGAAVDHCPDIGRMGSAEDAATYPRFIVEAFEAEGLVWGGRWKLPDAMHFELQE